eukprot:14323532-Heterocapsa_arctica.AAC.1
MLFTYGLWPTVDAYLYHAARPRVVDVHGPDALVAVLDPEQLVGVRDPEQLVDVRRWLSRSFATTFAQDQGHLKLTPTGREKWRPARGSGKPAG